MGKKLIKRIEAFAWHSLMMVLAFAIEELLKDLSVLNLTSEVTVVIGLVLGQVSKALNNYISEKE